MRRNDLCRLASSPSNRGSPADLTYLLGSFWRLAALFSLLPTLLLLPAEPPEPIDEAEPFLPREAPPLGTVS